MIDYKLPTIVLMLFMICMLCMLCITAGIGSAAEPSSIHEIIEQLDSPAPATRLEATETLTALATSAFDALVDALQDPDAVALGRIDPQAANVVTALRMAQRNGSSANVQWAATETLVAIDPTSAVSTLIVALHADAWLVRTQAAERLGLMGPAAKDAVPVLADALTHRNINVPLAAAWALGEIGAEAEAAVPALALALQHRAANVREFAATALKKIGPEVVVPALFEALQVDDPAGREHLVAALVRIGEPAVTTLLQLLDESNGSLQETAADALEEITGERPEGF